MVTRRKWDYDDDENENEYENENENVKEKSKIAQRIVRVSSSAVTCIFLLVYALNVAQTYPRFRNLPWIKDVLDKTSGAFPSLLASPMERERFIVRFFKAHTKSFKFFKKPYVDALAAILPEQVPGIPVKLDMFQKIIEFASRPESKPEELRGGLSNLFSKAMSVMKVSVPEIDYFDIREAFADVVVDWGIMPWLIFAYARFSGLREAMPMWVFAVVQTALALNAVKGHYVD